MNLLKEVLNVVTSSFGNVSNSVSDLLDDSKKTSVDIVSKKNKKNKTDLEKPLTKEEIDKIDRENQEGIDKEKQRLKEQEESNRDGGQQKEIPSGNGDGQQQQLSEQQQIERKDQSLKIGDKPSTP
jgi:hypothetical protein